MSEMIVKFDELQKFLEPFFGGKNLRIVVKNSVAKIVEENPVGLEDRPIKSKGILKAYADISKIPEEEGAWERAVVEKYGKNYS